VPQCRDLLLITADENCYLKADHKYVAVVTAESEALLSTPLKNLHARLDLEVFWQVHRGTVVNIQAVRSIHRGLAGRLSLSLRERPETPAVGPRYAHLFRQWWRCCGSGCWQRLLQAGTGLCPVVFHPSCAIRCHSAPACPVEQQVRSGRGRPTTSLARTMA
jgi:hypothetical protein